MQASLARAASAELHGEERYPLWRDAILARAPEVSW